jgi:dimethylargininase
LRALTRQIGDLNDCELSYRQRQPIDVARARRQHREYEDRLRQLGVDVLSLPPEPDLPDSVFVEDTALVLPEAAFILPMGASSRLPERESIAKALAAFREVIWLDGPGSVDGGDVLRTGHKLYVGLSGRTNAAGIESLRQNVAPLGYEVQPVAVRNCLHLKSACTEAADGLILVNPDWVDVSPFRGMELLTVAPDEPDASNVLRVDEALVVSACFPHTEQRLRARGLEVHAIDNAEILKAEGALTCTSLLFD